MIRHIPAAAAATLVLALAGCLPATRHLPDPAVSGGRSGATDAALERAAADPTIGSARRLVLQTAASWLGTPYRYAGTTREGVDCSGFVWNVFQAVHRRLPRSSAEQSRVGEPIALAEARPGDLVFFNTSGAGVSHVGIIVDERTFVHSSTTRGVIVSGLDEAYYQERIVGVRQVLGDDRAER